MNVMPRLSYCQNQNLVNWRTWVKCDRIKRSVGRCAIAQLQELLDDTYLAVGSEAYTAALQVYNYAKASGNVGGLDTVVEEMGQRFARKSRKLKSEDTTMPEQS